MHNLKELTEKFIVAIVTTIKKNAQKLISKVERKQ